MTETTLVNVGQVESNLEEKATIEELTTEIQFYLGQIGQNIIEVGKRLIQAKKIVATRRMAGLVGRKF